MRTRVREVMFSVPFVIGKARPQVTIHGTYTPAKTRQAEQAIREAYEQAVADKGGTVDDYRAPAHESVSLRIETQRPLPESRKKSMSTEPDTYKPDADNVAKLVLDALNDVAWADDAQVDELVVSKGYRYRGTSERTTVRVLWGNDWSEE